MLYEIYATKAPFIATQLNSTQLDVELSSVELSCVALDTLYDADRRQALSGTQPVSAKQVSSFLPARRYASAGLCDSDVSGRLSVRPSVRPSVTRRYCA